MKNSFLCILTLSLLLVSCASPAPTETPAPQADPFDIPWTDRSIFESGLVESAQPILESLDGASVYRIEFNIAEDLYHVSGHQDVQYTNLETTALDQVEFMLFPNTLGGRMEISNLVANEQSVNPELQLNDSLLVVPLPAPLEPGRSVVIGMDFELTVPQTVDRNYGVLAYDEDVLALAHAYPMVAVYDDEGWNDETPPPYGDITYADASFFLVRITAPQGVTVVTSGKEFDRSNEGSTQTIHVASGPARDFYLAASPLYEETVETFGEVTIRSYSLPGFAKGAREALDAASNAIKIFGSLYGPYPYTDFDIVSTPNQALGIEYPGMTAIASRIYDVDEEVNGTPLRIYLESTVAHEVGHQWFYNLVGNDQLDDPWLDEALTQFVTLQYYEGQYGPQGAAGFEQSLEARWSRVNRAMIPIGLPVGAYDEGEYGAIVYGRGPLFFIALQKEMGAEAFDAFLKDYTEQLSWGIATPEFLQSLAEQHCACDLDSLFAEWVHP